MDSKNIRGLCEAYVAVYDEDLRGEFETISLEEDLSFIDDFSDNELDEVMENLFLSGEIDINECFDSLDYVLTEARVTSSEDRPSGSSRVTTSAERPSRVRRTAERKREVRVGRLAQAAQRTGEKLASAARSKGTSVAGRVKQAGGKISSAKEKIKGFLGKVGRAAKAGATAAKKEFSGQTAKETKAKRTGYEMRKSARKQAAKAHAQKSFADSKKSAPTKTTKTSSSIKGALPPAKESDRRVAAKAKLAKASAGSTAKGIRFAGERVGQLASQRAHTGHQSALEKFRKKSGISEDVFNDILNSIFEDMIHEGYVDTYENALYVVETLSENDIEEIVESYLIEEVETVDLYDVVLEHLLDEGYADTIESAEAIMVNMSEEWRSEIVEVTLSAKAARAGKDIGKPGKAFAKIAASAGKRYGSKERGEKVAGAILAKMRAKRG